MGYINCDFDTPSDNDTRHLRNSLNSLAIKRPNKDNKEN